MYKVNRVPLVSHVKWCTVRSRKMRTGSLVLICVLSTSFLTWIAAKWDNLFKHPQSIVQPVRMIPRG